MSKFSKYIFFMKNDFVYGWKSILIVFIQMLVGVLVLSYSMSLIFKNIAVTESINQFEKNHYMYQFANNSESYESPTSNDDAICESYKQFYEFLKADKSISLITANDSSEIILDQQKYRNLDVICDAMGPGVSVETLEVSPNFFEFYGIENKIDRVYQGNSRCILLGYNFRDKFKLGEKIRGVYGDEYIIAGFFEKETYYVTPFSTDKMNYLDNKAVMLLDDEKVDDYAQADLNITYSLIVANNSTEITKIQNVAYSLGLTFYKAIDYTDQADYAINNIREELLIMLAICIVVLIFATIGLLSNLKSMVEDNMYEYAVYLICGQPLNSLIIRIIIWPITILVVSLIISYIIFGFNIVALIVTVLMLVYMLLGLWNPVRKLCKDEIINTLRSNQ